MRWPWPKPRNSPAPFDAIAERRGSTLLYLGSGATDLHRRLVHDELLGRGHGSFFRGIGAALHHRPLVGSLTARANQHDYTFETEEVDAIAAWIAEHVLVSWVVLETGAEASERELLAAHAPLFNLRGNPRPVPEVRELHRLCAAIARGPHAPLEPT